MAIVDGALIPKPEEMIKLLYYCSSSFLLNYFTIKPYLIK